MRLTASTARSGIVFTLVVAAIFGAVAQASAQLPFSVLHDLTGSSSEGPRAGLILGRDGNLYGTTRGGGAFDLGTVFRVTGAGTFTPLHSFSGGDGRQPAAALLQASDGNFYGTTEEGPSCPGCGAGAIFRMTPAGAVTVVHAFSDNMGSTVGPFSPLVQGVDGSLYGSTHFGGPFQAGTIFRLTLDGDFTEFHAFAGDVGGRGDGFRPSALIQGRDGNFYGTTLGGGASATCRNSFCGDGTAFRMTPGGAVTILHSFARGVDGFAPQGVVEGRDGNFYGTTAGGTAFRMTPAGNVTVLHVFPASFPNSPLVQVSDGSFFGTTAVYGPGGTVFRMTENGDVSVPHTFASDLDGLNPLGVVQAADGRLYGATSSGGIADVGTLFVMDVTGVTTVLYRFPGSVEGAGPQAPVVQGRDGNFYGTTPYGGIYNHGTIFRVTPSGALTSIYAFSGGLDGGLPFGALVQARDGNLYGTTSRNGAFDAGIAFRLGFDGTFAILHAFAGAGQGDGANPRGALIQASDGNLYGTTSGGGTFDRGTVFRMTLAGNVTTLHAFSVTEGAPSASLVQASDGNFYGTGWTSAFRLTLSGAFTTLRLFADEEGYAPAIMAQGSDGNLYGATQCDGKLFRMSLGGELTVLAATGTYCSDYGPQPVVTIMAGRDGTLYGSVFGSCWCRPSDFPIAYAGTIFAMTPGGVVTPLHQFTGASDGLVPQAVIQATDGNLYGVTSGGGSRGAGVIFRLNLHAPPIVPKLSVAVSVAGPGVRLTWAGGWGATSYTIRRAMIGGGETVVARGITTTMFTDATAVPGMVYTYVITAVNAYGESTRSNGVGGPIGLASRTPTVTTIGDYDGDHHADLTVYRVPTGQWLTHRSHDGAASTVLFGGAARLQDRPVPADYDGDGVTDVAVYRETTGQWFVHRSSDDKTEQVGWGSPTDGDVPVPADYDGDGRADIAVYRGTTGEWFIRRSTDGTLVHLVWGSATDGDLPVPADYDADGHADIAVYRSTTGEWFILRSSDGALVHVAWGAPALGDVPVPADYDGDGHADVAVYRGTTGEWFIHRSSDGVLVQFGWGAPLLGDVPVPGDYDGDGRQDVAVFREQTGEWFIHRSSDGGLTYWPFWGSPALGDLVRPY